VDFHAVASVLQNDAEKPVKPAPLRITLMQQNFHIAPSGNLSSWDATPWLSFSFSDWCRRRLILTVFCQFGVAVFLNEDNHHHLQLCRKKKRGVLHLKDV